MMQTYKKNEFQVAFRDIFLLLAVVFGLLWHGCGCCGRGKGEIWAAMGLKCQKLFVVL